jgi:hypothetical protein
MRENNRNRMEELVALIKHRLIERAIQAIFRLVSLFIGTRTGQNKTNSSIQ